MDIRNSKNVFIIGKSNIVFEGLIEMAVSEAEHGNTVLYLASKPVDKLPEVFLRQDRSVLKRIIFTYLKTLDALIQKLMDLHNVHNITPSLIIIDALHSFQPGKYEHVLQAHAKTFAGLHSAVDSFDEIRRAPCWSIVSLDDDANGGYDQQNLATIIDLYYYQRNFVRAVDSTFVSWVNQFKSKFVK